MTSPGFPEHAGVGVQGGDLEETCDAALDSAGLGLILPISRSISRAADPGAMAAEFRDRINAARVSCAFCFSFVACLPVDVCVSIRRTYAHFRCNRRVGVREGMCCLADDKGHFSQGSDLEPLLVMSWFCRFAQLARFSIVYSRPVSFVVSFATIEERALQMLVYRKHDSLTVFLVASC